MRTHTLLLAVLLSATGAHADVRTSANYTLTTDTYDSGGGRTSATNIVNDGSMGGIVGISTSPSAPQSVKLGYIGQLYDTTALQLTADADSLHENGTLQLHANRLLDDATTLAVAPESVTWSVHSGPISTIDLSGIATAETVYQDTAAVVQGDSLGFTGTLNLTVINVNTDDLPWYAGDGIDDAWQVQYFGLPGNRSNPDAAPDAISDGSGLTNLFKYTAGLIPRDPSSIFISLAMGNSLAETAPGPPLRQDWLVNPPVRNA